MNLNEAPKGLLTNGECRLLLASSAGSHLAVDLGTCSGLSAWVIGKSSDIVITFDLHEDYKNGLCDGKNKNEAAGIYKNYSHTHKKVSDYFDGSNVICLKNNTSNAASVFANESIDFLMIDANHEYNGVKLDFDSWFPKVKPGGKIAFHDALNDRYWNVVEFLDKEVRTRKDIIQISQIEALAVFQKK